MQKNEVVVEEETMEIEMDIDEEIEIDAPPEVCSSLICEQVGVTAWGNSAPTPRYGGLKFRKWPFSKSRFPAISGSCGDIFGIFGANGL